MIVFFLTLITTLSTSGYIGMIILIFCFLQYTSKTVDKRMKYAYMIMVIGTILFYQ